MEIIKALKQSKERWPFLLKLTICGDLVEIFESFDKKPKIQHNSFVPTSAENLINNLMYCSYIDVLSLEADRWKHCSHYS